MTLFLIMLWLATVFIGSCALLLLIFLSYYSGVAVWSKYWVDVLNGIQIPTWMVAAAAISAPMSLMVLAKFYQ